MCPAGMRQGLLTQDERPAAARLPEMAGAASFREIAMNHAGRGLAGLENFVKSARGGCVIGDCGRPVIDFVQPEWASPLKLSR